MVEKSLRKRIKLKDYLKSRSVVKLKTVNREILQGTEQMPRNARGK